MSECLHKEGALCGKTCECTCDECQDEFEIQWKKGVLERDLCDFCGMPTEMTLGRVKEEHHMHFFQPCDACSPKFLALMKEHKMCPTCQQTLTTPVCSECSCTEEPSTCECRQCVAYRKSMNTH